MNNLTVKPRIVLVLIILTSLATAAVIVIRAHQVQVQTNTLLEERLQGNANMTFGIFDTVRTYTEWILNVAEGHAQAGLADADYDLAWQLSNLYNNMNREFDGVRAYGNIAVFDADFNIIAVANADKEPPALFPEYLDEISSHQWISPVYESPETGRLQFLFTKPVFSEDELIGVVALTANTEMLAFFLRDFIQVYDSFINTADRSGVIFFSNRPEAYMGRHVDELGVIEAFGHIPMNTVFEHTSALTGSDKIAYVTFDPELNWTIVSFFDADAVESSARIIFMSLLPTVGGIILAAGLIVIIIHRSLKPLQDLAGNAKEVSKGNIAVNFRVNRNDEISQVAISFMEIVRALNILRSNFKKAENAMARGEMEYALEDSRLGGIYDDMIASTGNIVGHMKESMRQAERASKAKSDFLAKMSHEIRTPLNAVIGITQIELQREELPDEYAMVFEKIYASGSGLLGIINDILDMSKIEMGKLELSPGEYDVPSLINDTVNLNMVRIASRPINFVLEIDETLPSKLVGDEVRLKQILNNLLSNALKYTEKGRVTLSVKHFYGEEFTTLQFTVSDTGQGMKPEDCDQLFTEYKRFNTDANRTTEGTGLGLSITKTLIEMMEGTIGVESKYGEGSTFTAEVRQGTVECQPIGAELAKQLRNFTFAGERKVERRQIVRELMPYGKVLIVDDAEMNLYVASGLMFPYKVKIDTADSGFAALEKIEAGNVYDVIFMDHMMPKMDGIETTQKIRELGYTGAIVALTANALIGNEEMFARHGFDGFIAKPIDVRLLNTALNKFVRDRHPEEAATYKYTATMHAEAEEVPNSHDAELLRVFCNYTKKAVATLRETTETNDIKLFTITVHALKTALANIGENEMSELAAQLENAGKNGDTAFITANSVDFIARLEVLLEKHEKPEAEERSDIDEDTAFLAEQLQIVKTACENYDDDAAYVALDRLKEKSWNSSTLALLEEIRDTLFVHSDFDKAAGLAERV